MQKIVGSIPTISLFFMGSVTQLVEEFVSLFRVQPEPSFYALLAQQVEHLTIFLYILGLWVNVSGIVGRLSVRLRWGAPICYILEHMVLRGT